MSKKKKSSLVGSLKDIVKEALNLVNALKPKVEKGVSISSKEFREITKLIKHSEDTLSEASKRGKQRRREQIQDLEQLIENLELALATPGLDENVRGNLKNLKRKKRAQLLHLGTKEAMDFGGILTTRKINEIEGLLKQAKSDVAKKKKASTLLGTLMKLADIGLSIAAKTADIAL